jgi:hypothetical protein
MKTKTVLKGSKQNRYQKGIRLPMMSPKKIVKNIFGYDDFLNQIIAMKEQGNLAISGIRIC